MTEQLVDAAECESLDEVTLDHTVKGWAREESSIAENARALADWMETLEKANVSEDVIDDIEVGEYSAEIHFTVTMGEAYRLMDAGWDCAFPEDVDSYLAEHVLGDDTWPRSAETNDLLERMHERLLAELRSENEDNNT